MSNTAQPRYRAVSMELAAYLDGHYVEMHIVTDAGETVAIVCPRDSIFAIQRHIAQIGRDCPEISTWSQDPSAASMTEVMAMGSVQAPQPEWRQ
jgi:hypothetical protein